jgi:hypothetical protein
LSIDTILAQLKAERDRLNRAIAALEGVASDAPASRTIAPPKARKRSGHKMSTDARKRISEAKKAWWAKKKGKRAA